MTIWTELANVEFSLGYVDAGGLRTRTLRAGRGEPVVMLHGTSGHLEAFVRNIAVLADHVECHAIDMMGHGYTDSPGQPYRIPGYVRHVLDYLDAVGIERAHFIGESLGGWVSGRLAADHPERVLSVTLVAPGGTVANPAVMDRIKTSTRRAVLSDDIELTRKRLHLLMHDPGNATEELVEVRHAIYHRPEFMANLDHLLCLQEMNNRREDLLNTEQMARISAPTRIVWGAENPFGDIPEANAMHAAIPGSALTIYPQCGHWPQHEHAERFNKETLEFLAGVPR
ncbi:alpha/beta fold hydrolase [Micromonospora craniellae]|uniref:Alpha/beta fold hydrolase n=1 Tax=Micromonospora craniellae TaxID=2294034 RepID=A0A372FYK5_9ACTN|nr:alpha/beta fold hydrolase [Micromonospora craniellae]QOC93418.1 alpha/beta fold hydrolase [Micromonospora craniellae]RFS45865.1 alpha/beta fold hydrolase [Micromonospora craniellae]